LCDYYNAKYILLDWYEVEEVMYEVILKRFDKPDAVRNFEKGKFELAKVGKMTIGRATYEPGWKWSEHVGKVAGEKSCMVEHIGLVVAGRATAAMDDGRVIEMKPGDLFYIAPGHDSWVVGNEPYVSLHFVGAELYATGK
jgi:quercetin dioxygenase-like cupin family protein